MAKPKITLFVDIVSPFAYLAYYVLRTSRVFKQCDLTYIPMFLGGVMKECGNRPPIEIKNKDKWIEIERKRWMKYFNVPMVDKMMEGFPPSTLIAQRVLCAIELRHPEKLIPSLDAVYKMFWVDGKDPRNAEFIATALVPVLGDQEAKAMMEMATQAEAKGKLQANTSLAVAEGAFGIPWIVATNARGEKECYFGVDHLGQVIHHLGIEKPDSATESGWRAVL